MLSLRVWGSVVSSVLAATLVVTLVEPAAAVEGDNQSSGANVSIATEAIPASVPSFTVPVPALPTGDFSEAFPPMEDEPSDIVAVDPVNDVPSFSETDVASGVEVGRDEFSVTRVVDGFTVDELSSVPISVAGVNGEWVPIGTDFEPSSSHSVAVPDNPLNPVVTDLATGAGVLSLADGDVSLSTQLLGALPSDVSLSTVDGSEAAVFNSVLPNGVLWKSRRG